MTITNTEGDAWATFKREFALDDWPTPPQHAADGATLAPLRVNRRPKRTPYRRPKGTPFVEQRNGDDGRTVRAGCGVGRA
jgi:hypothetical protein